MYDKLLRKFINTINHILMYCYRYCDIHFENVQFEVYGKRKLTSTLLFSKFRVSTWSLLALMISNDSKLRSFSMWLMSHISEVLLTNESKMGIENVSNSQSRPIEQTKQGLLFCSLQLQYSLHYYYKNYYGAITIIMK